MVTLLHPDGVAFVTGAGGCVGRAVVQQFARDGVTKIAGLDVSLTGLTEFEGILKTEFPSVSFLPLVVDITKQAEVEDAVAQTVAKFGRLDYAVNNASVTQSMRPTTEADPSEFDKVIGINLKGTWLCERAELQQMLKQDPLPSVSGVAGRVAARGAIVNVDSILGLLVMPNLAFYTMGKHGIIGLTKTDALDFAKKGIRVNAVCPGFIDTPLLDEAKRQALKPCIDKTPMGRLANAVEIADSITFLVSERSSYMTGECLTVDGGYCLH